jgi:CBS domain-containing protein
MTSDPRSIETSSSVADAAQLLRLEDVGSLPIVREGVLMGMRLLILCAPYLALIALVAIVFVAVATLGALGGAIVAGLHGLGPSVELRIRSGASQRRSKYSGAAAARLIIEALGQ